MTVAYRAALLALLLLLAPAAAADGEPEHRPEPSVTLSLAEPSPIIGVTGETELRIVVSEPPDVPVLAPRVSCSAGQIEDLGRESPSSFTARYILPSGRFPQAAILVAEISTSRGPLRGWLPVPLRAAATPALRTDPGAQVTVRVEDRDFGPQNAAADGLVHVPVVVPPGVERARARSVNQHGKATEQTIDLRVPYSQRVLIVPPPSLAAGAVGEVAVYAVEPSGKPARADTLVMRAVGATVQPLGSLVPGEARFLVTAPPVLRERHLRLQAQIKGQSTTRVTARLPVVPGRPAELSIEPEVRRPRRGPRAGLRIFLHAEDAYGNPVDATEADVLVDGNPGKVEATEEGDAVVVVPPLERGRPARELVIEGVLGDAHQVATIPIAVRRAHAALPPLQPPPPRHTLTPRLGLLWNLGVATGQSLFLEAATYPSSRYPNFGLGVSLGVLASTFDAAGAAGSTRTTLSTLPVLFELHQRFSPRRMPMFLGVGAGAGFALAFARMVSFGQTVSGQGFGAAFEAFAETGTTLGSGQLVLSLRYLGVYLDELSSGDRVHGNAAGTLADVGYRFVW